MKFAQLNMVLAMKSLTLNYPNVTRYTAARGNPNTNSHICFLINEFILQMHTMNFWKYHHQYFTDSSCDFIPTQMPQGI